MRKLTKMMADDVTFGVELETIIPVGAPVMVGGYHRGTPVTTAPAFNGRFWKAERDGSIAESQGMQACEFVSPVLSGPAGVENLIAMVRWIEAIGGKVNRTCGCHIHIGVQSVIRTDDRGAVAKFVKKFARIVNINTEALYAQTGSRRDENRYTSRLSLDIRQTIDVAAREGRPSYSCDRYHVVNVQSLGIHGTVEIRAFAGTLCVTKIMHHLWTVLFMACFARELDSVRWSGKGWGSQEGGAGEKALRGLWTKMGNHCLVGAMAGMKDEMKAEALRLARKYDSLRPVAA